MDDLISRQEAIDALDCINGVEEVLRSLPPVQLEQHYDEWCTGCKEYDQKRHNCPRWNKVIRQTLKDIEPKEGHWIDKGDDGDWAWQIDGRGNTWHVWGCSECGKSVFVESDYCPHCGSYNGGGRK